MRRACCRSSTCPIRSGRFTNIRSELYGELEKETGQHVGFSRCSNIRLARTRDRWDEFMYYAGVAETIGVKVNKLTPAQLKEIWPLALTDGILGAIQHPDDGYIQPADLTQAFAKGARAKGAEIHRNTRVNAIEQKANGEWRVQTDQGDIICEHVVSATGNFARPTGAMVGLDIPVIPVEHQYIVTEAAPEDPRAPGARACPKWACCARPIPPGTCARRRAACCSDPTRRARPCCYVDGPSEKAEYELFQEDLERLEPHIETAIARVPAFGEVGIKKIYNGAIAYTPDGSPIIGPAWGKRNFWLNEGHSFGVTAAGGAGWQLAEWITEGEPTIDMMGVDPRRFGPYASEGYLKLKNEEAYANVFTVHYPDEERAAARPLKTAPCYSRMEALGAVFGTVYGWERPGWFAPKGYGLDEAALGRPDTLLRHNHAPAASDGRIKEKWSFRRSNYFPIVGEECRHVSENVGLQDMSAFAKMEVSGPGARAWLDSILANRIPKTRGRIALCHLLTPGGRRALGVHALRMDAGAVLSRVGGRLRAPRPRHPGAAPARRRLGDAHPHHDAASACWCWPGRSRARCWRSSPLPICRTRRSRGCRASRSRSARAPRMRCA